MKKKLITIAIDSPAAAGAGTQAKMIAKHYNLFHLDTGKLYRYIGLLKLENPKKFSLNFIKKKIKKLKFKKLSTKKLLSDEVAVSASLISKIHYVRKAILSFQRKSAYSPPKKFDGSVLDGRDITHRVVPDAFIKLYITARVNQRAKRRFKELKKLEKRVNYQEILKSIKNRDKSDRMRPLKLGKLIKTKDSILINTTNLTKKAFFLKIKKIIDKKLNKWKYIKT